MSRLTTISMLGLAAIATLNAGQIQINLGAQALGGATNPTATFATQTFYGQTSSTCTGASLASNGTFTGCKAPTANPSIGAAGQQQSLTSYSSLGPAERTLSGSLFGGATLGTALTQTTFTDSVTGGAFNRTSDGTGQDVWAVVTGTSLVVPVGIYGVDKVWTMLNDYWGVGGKQNTTVSFLFGTASDGSGTNNTVDVTLTNGQQIRSSVICNTPSSSGIACPSVAGTGGPTGSLIATGLTSSSTVSGVGITTGSVDYSSTYSGFGTNGPYRNAGGSTSGNVVLDDQLFTFGSAHTTEFLVSITISNALGTSQSGVNVSRTALSGITVNQVPEPSTILMALTGLGAVGYFRRRRKA
jgi:hypothetical protein